MAVMTNQITVTLVVLLLGIMAIGSMAGTIWLVHEGVQDSVLLLAISTPGSTALGGIIGVLSNSNVRNNPKNEA